jgi:hypothetical protein
MMGISDYEVLPPHAIPARYTGVAEDAGVLSGDDPALNENTTETDPVVGSGPELGGVPADSRTSDGASLSDADVVNLTGMSVSPQVAKSTGPNINGSGTDDQQLPSRKMASSGAVQAVQAVMSGLVNRGASLVTAQVAPTVIPGTTTLHQTGESGISKVAMMVLFFLIGAGIAAVVIGE